MTTPKFMKEEKEQKLVKNVIADVDMQTFAELGLGSVAQKFTTEGKGERAEDLDANAGSLTGRFITMKEIRDISPVKDFRIAFDLHKENGLYRVGKQKKTTFPLIGVGDCFNKPPEKGFDLSFEAYLKKTTSWNLMNTISDYDGSVIYDETNINVFIQDTFDVIRFHMDDALIKFVESDFSSSAHAFFWNRLKEADLDDYDRFIYFLSYLYEHLLTTGFQQTYTLMESFFVGIKIPLSYFISKFHAYYFRDLRTLHAHFSSLPLCNRRERVQYSVKFREGNLWDTYQLTNAIEAFIEAEELDNGSFDIIANAIKAHSPKRELITTVKLKRTMRVNEDDLRALGLPKKTEDVVDLNYEIKLDGFIVDGKFPSEFSYRELLNDPSTRKFVNAENYLQIEEITKLVKFTDGALDVNDVIIQASKDNFVFDEYSLAGVMVDQNHLGKQKKATLSKDGEVIKTIEYCARKQASPRFLVANDLAILKVPKQRDVSFTREINDGLYEHQVRFIDRNLEAIFSKQNETTVYSAVVGCGKSTSVASLAYALKTATVDFKEPKKTVIYCMWAKKVLKEIFIKSKEIGLDVLSSFETDGGRYVIKAANDTGTQNSQNIPFENILDYDILVCHPLVLLKHLAMYDNKRRTSDSSVPNILDNVIVVVDELNSERLNSTPEHALASLLAFNPKHLCVLSASIEKNKHINYLRSLSKLTVIESVNIMTPAILRQMNGLPMDVFCWQKPNTTKVLSNSFLRRFLSLENVLFDDDFVSEMRYRGVFDVATMFEIFSLTHAHCEIPVVGNVPLSQTMIDQRFAPNKDFDIETECIKKSENYTLVSCSDSSKMACSIYGHIVRRILALLETKVNEIEVLFQKEAKIKEELGKPCYRETKEVHKMVDKVMSEYEKRQNPDLILDESGKVTAAKAKTTPEQRTKLTTMAHDEDRFNSDMRGIFKRLAENKSLSEEQRSILERSIVFCEKKSSSEHVEPKLALDESQLSEGTRRIFSVYEKNMLVELSGIQQLKAQEYRLKETMLTKEALLTKRARCELDRASLQEEIIKTIEGFLVSEGIFHKYAPTVTLEGIKKWSKDKSEDYIWDLIGVFIESKRTEDLPIRSQNRIFAGEALSRGVNLPIEAVIITDDFVNTVSVDTLLQTTGRCGRPGLSNIAIVYMSAKAYLKVYNEKASNDVEKIMQRTNFYLQTPSQVDVLKAPNVRVGETRRLDVLLQHIVGR